MKCKADTFFDRCQLTIIGVSNTRLNTVNALLVSKCYISHPLTRMGGHTDVRKDDFVKSKQN